MDTTDLQHQRGVVPPVPDDLMSFLNREQLLSFHNVERFGWFIKFIRRPLFQRPMCVLSNPDGSVLAVLENDGKVNQEAEIHLRN